MNKFSHIILIFLFLFKGEFLYTQDNWNKLELITRCYEDKYIVNRGIAQTNPSFILGIKNKSYFEIELDQSIYFGHADHENGNDITFELFLLSENDTIDILKNIIAGKGYRVKQLNKVLIYPQSTFYFEFNQLDAFYFKKSGRYKIRFTLLKKYASEYLNQNVSTDWIYFDVEVIPASKQIED